MLMALFKQPKAVFLLAFVQLWNRFSHYGMRALLLLYMINMQMFSDGAAIGIFAVYCALVELGGVFGAHLAQRFLGLRRAVMVGGWLIGIGHLLLALEIDFFIALGFVIVGSCLYTTNVATLLGEYYPEGDERREQGFTIFYMSINVGAFAANAAVRIFCRNLRLALRLWPCCHRHGAGQRLFVVFQEASARQRRASLYRRKDRCRFLQEH
jgi:proton-dependent oligopeptide transporter, POT family